MLDAYSKVFAIIRRHRRQITRDQGNNGGINLGKYKKSVFTILYILACSVVTYAPHVICVVIVGMLKDYTEISAAFLHLTSTIVYWSSSLNPIVYCWRMKRIRDSVKEIVRCICMSGKKV